MPFRPAADTLYEQLASAQGDERTRILNWLAFYHSFIDIDSTNWYAEKVLDMARKRGNRQEEAKAIRHIGHALIIEGKYREAISRFLEALKIYKEINDIRGQFEALFSLAKVNYDAWDFQRCSEYVDHILEMVAEHETDGQLLFTPLERSQLIASVAIVKRENKEYDEAVRYFKEYIRLSEPLDVTSYQLLHKAYVTSLGGTYEFMGMLDSALKYTLMARDLLPWNKGKRDEEKTGDEMSLGMLYADMGEIERGFPLLERAFKQFVEENSFMYASWSASQLGRIYLAQGNDKMALSYFQQALELAVRMQLSKTKPGEEKQEQNVYSGYQLMYLKIGEKWMIRKYYESMVRALENFHDFYLSAGDSLRAYRYFVDLTAYRDSLNNITQDIEFNRMQLRYESDQLEEQVTILSQENELNRMQLRRTIWLVSGGGVFVLLMILFGLMWFRQNRLRDRQHALELEQRLMRTQMNPHFIFNSLASIQNFIVTQEPMKASTYLSRFANLVRSILDNSVEEFIPFDDEIKTIENYLALQKVRYEDKFDYMIEVDPAIDAESMMIPPMLAQPFIENAIEHGFKQKKDKGRLSIRILKSSDDLILFEVEDDGIGREKARELLQSSDPKHRSMATAITRERLAVLNRKLKQKITLGIIDLKDEEGNPTGTLVRFGIPVKT